MQHQLDTSERIASVLDFEARTFDHLKASSDLTLVAFLFATLDKVADPWLRVELDAVATVACTRWSQAAFDSFESSLIGRAS